ncbi:MAG: SRPBCC family protein [Acidimicrobiales bacterium]
MADFHAVVDVATPADEVFAYLADFANVAEWDPSVRSAEALSSEDPAIGSRYSVTVGFYGRPFDFRYEITELVPGRRLVLGAEGRRATRHDVFEVAEHGSGARITYDTTVKLKGPARLLDRGLQLALGGVGENAVSGLRQRLG